MNAAPTTASRLLTGSTALFLLAAVGATASFYLLLTVVPTYAAGGRGAGDASVAAGLATATLMLATVVAELAAPRLIARYGRRAMLAAGLTLLGGPALLLGVSNGLPAILAVSGLRGLGFGVAVVLGSSWMAALVPAARRGEALGIYGVAIGLSSIAALPLGVFLVDRWGYGPVFLAGGLAALLGLVPLTLIASPSTMDSPGTHLGVVRGLRTAALIRPATVFAGTAAAAGIVVTFLPAAVSGGAVGFVAPALLAHSVGATVGRWFAGRYGDRFGPARVFPVGALVAAAGVLGLALTGEGLAVMAGAAVFGLGFGAAQNASITLMFAGVGPGGYDTASAVWNIGYDAGMGLGAAAFGVLAGVTGFPLGFVIVAALIPAALPLLGGWARRPTTKTEGI